ncbi:hypothetical protein N665_2668s0004 [Sinapis alba]|nr:hypothetical protein N665_2668s0004 [Sinapis alba]
MNIISNFLIINLIKLHNLPKTLKQPLKYLFSRETETTNVPNLFEHHPMSVNDATIH